MEKPGFNRKMKLKPNKLHKKRENNSLSPWQF